MNGPKSSQSPNANQDPSLMLTTPELVKALGSTDARIRSYAVGRLGLVNTGTQVREVMPSLIKLLHDPDRDIRGEVLALLFLFPDAATQAVPTLLEIMTDLKEPGDIRYLAIGVVEKIRAEPKVVVPSLMELLSVRHRNPRIRISPISIEKLGPDDLRISAANALGDLGAASKAAVPILTEIVKSRNEASEMQIAAIRALPAIGPDAKEAIPVLAEALQSDDWGLRESAATALGRFGPEAQNAVPALIAAMKDKELEVRREAIRALGAIGPDAKAAIEPLKGALAEKAVKLTAKDALKKIAPSVVVPSK
jgi:HEAT repeat protein